MAVVNLVRQITCAVLLTGVSLGQTASGPGVTTQSTASPPQTTKQSSVQASDELAQMRDDLNKMESLNLNMSSEIEFLHDQNLQILLRTNSQMWTILIRDLRRQIEQQRKPAAPSPR